jgi:tRNA(fMet)-specific endonuclease VapC
MYFLDTDTLSWAHAGQKKVMARIEEIGEDNVVTTAITAIEILRGRQEFLLKANDGERLLLAQRLLQRSQELLEEIRIVPVDAKASAVFDDLLRHKRLKKNGRADILIASIVLASGGILITRNIKHFQQIPGLLLENWVD